MSKPSSALSKLFSRQQPKVKHTARKAAFLKTFSDNELEPIAKVIKLWLSEAENQSNNKRNKH